MLPYGLPSATPDIAALLTQTTATPPAAFTWGAGGQRMTPEEIAAQRKRAEGMMQSDYSPVGHWTQGLARVANNVVGGLQMREADRAAQANAAQSAGVAKALANPGASGQTFFTPDPVAKSGGGLFGLLGRIF